MLDPQLVYRNPLLMFFKANYAVCTSSMKEHKINGSCNINMYTILFYFIREYVCTCEKRINVGVAYGNFL